LTHAAQIGEITMPQFGLKTKEQIGVAAPVNLEAHPSLPWKLAGAQVVQVTYEVDLDSALELLPEQIARPVPPYARIIVASYPDTPLGPYSEALLLLGARFRMEPKNYVIAAVVTTEAARAAYEGLYGTPTSVGAVSLTSERNAATGAEDITADIAAASPLASIHLPAAYAVEPAMIRYDPYIAVRVPGGDEAEVIQFSGAPTIHEARLAKGATVTCRTDAWSDPWFRLRSLNMISATFAVADLELTEPVVQQLRPPGGGMGGGLP
jgi:acetoacetate decarboxylase